MLCDSTAALIARDADVGVMVVFDVAPPFQKSAPDLKSGALFCRGHFQFAHNYSAPPVRRFQGSGREKRQVNLGCGVIFVFDVVLPLQKRAPDFKSEALFCKHIPSRSC